MKHFNIERFLTFLLVINATIVVTLLFRDVPGKLFPHQGIFKGRANFFLPVGFEDESTHLVIRGKIQPKPLKAGSCISPSQFFS